MLSPAKAHTHTHNKIMFCQLHERNNIYSMPSPQEPQKVFPGVSAAPQFMQCFVVVGVLATVEGFLFAIRTAMDTITKATTKIIIR